MTAITGMPYWATTGVLDHLFAVNPVTIDDSLFAEYFNRFVDYSGLSYRDQDVYGIPSGTEDFPDRHLCVDQFHDFFEPPDVFQTPIIIHAPIPGGGDNNLIGGGFNGCVPDTCYMCWLYDNIADQNTQMPRMLNPTPDYIQVEIDDLTDGSMGEVKTLDLVVNSVSYPEEIDSLTLNYTFGYIYGLSDNAVINGNDDDIYCSLTHGLFKYTADYSYQAGTPTNLANFVPDPNDFNKFSQFNGNYILEKGNGGLNPPTNFVQENNCSYGYVESGIDQQGLRYTLHIRSDFGILHHNVVTNNKPCQITSATGYIVVTQMAINGYLMTWSKMINIDYPGYPSGNSNYDSSVHLRHIIPECEKIKDLELDFILEPHLNGLNAYDPSPPSDDNTDCGGLSYNGSNTGCESCVDRGLAVQRLFPTPDGDACYPYFGEAIAGIASDIRGGPDCQGIGEVGIGVDLEMGYGTTNNGVGGIISDAKLATDIPNNTLTRGETRGIYLTDIVRPDIFAYGYFPEEKDRKEAYCKLLETPTENRTLSHVFTYHYTSKSNGVPSTWRDQDVDSIINCIDNEVDLRDRELTRFTTMYPKGRKAEYTFDTNYLCEAETVFEGGPDGQLFFLFQPCIRRGGIPFRAYTYKPFNVALIVNDYYPYLNIKEKLPTCSISWEYPENMFTIEIRETGYIPDSLLI